MSTLLIIGAGGHGKVVAETAVAAQRWQEIVFLDDRYPSLRQCVGLDVAGVLEHLGSYDKQNIDVLVAIGSNQRRLQLVEELVLSGYSLPTLAHPTAWVSPSAVLGPSAVVFAQAAVNAEAHCGKAVIVNTGATIEHDCQLGNGVHVAPGAHLGGGVRVGDLSWVGIGAAVKHLISIGRNVTVGAGAVVVHDLADEVTAVGVPAKPISEV